MYWNELSARLEMEYRKLDGLELGGLLDPFPRTKEDFAETAGKREHTTGDTVDVAVRIFSTGQPWPELCNDELYFLEQRLFYGWMLASMFAITGTQPKKTGAPTDEWAESEQAILEWLLIDCWRPCGCLLWLDTQVERYVVIAAAFRREQQ